MMNEYNEKVIKDALTILRDEQDKEFLKEIEEANNNPDFKVEKGEARRFVKEVSKTKNYRPMLRAASIVLIIAASLTAVTISVDGFREKFTSFFTNFVSSDYAGVKVGTDDDLFLDYQGRFVPSIIPAGYEVDSILNEGNKFEIALKSKNDTMIVLREQTIDLKSNIDTEDADVVEEIEINGMSGLYVKKGRKERIALDAGDVMICITDNDTQVDLIGFTELIEKR